MQTSLQYNSDLDHVCRLQELTRAYARFSRSAAGLGNVLGGVLAMIMWMTSNFTPLSLWARVLFALFPIAWIVLKELIRWRFYQRHGLVREAWDPASRRWHIGITAFTALISAVVIGVAAYSLFEKSVVNWQWLGYLAFVAALPVCVWFYMRTVEEFLVGVLLFCQAAVLVAGGHYPLDWWTLFFPLFALIAIAAGVKQHLDYRKIDRELSARQGRS